MEKLLETSTKKTLQLSQEQYYFMLNKSKKSRNDKIKRNSNLKQTIDDDLDNLQLLFEKSRLSSTLKFT